MKEVLDKYRISDLRRVIGYRDGVNVGDKNMPSHDMNPLHWAAYEGHLEIVKLIIENHKFNILKVGKVPASSGLANESELCLDDIDVEDKDNGSEDSLQEQVKELATPIHKPVDPDNKPRSLILFWAIDHE